MEIDETILIDRQLPKSWKCPHCGKIHKFDREANDIFLEYFKLFRQCGNCGFVHYWQLKLTETMKKKIADELTRVAMYGMDRGE